MKRTSAVGNLPVPKAALMLPKSTPVFSIRALPPAPSFPSFQVISTPRTSHAISTRREVNEATHRKYETRPRVSRELAPSRFGEKPSAYTLEHPNEHSKVDIGPAVKLALTSSFSSEIGERLQVSNAAVSIQNETEEEDYAPEAFAPNTSAPFIPSVPHNDMAVLSRRSPLARKPITDTISRALPHSDVRAKAREQSKTVLSREFPKGSSLMGVKPYNRVNSAPATSKRMNACATEVKLTCAQGNLHAACVRSRCSVCPFYACRTPTPTFG